MNSLQLFSSLWRQQYPITDRDAYWWPNSGQFTVVIGALLTQQTRWEKVEESLSNLQGQGLLSLEAMANAELDILSEAIRPSGFYRMKSERLMLLARNMQAEFGDFTGFSEQVERHWLLSQKGIGQETADSILNYACYRSVMVVDAYTQRLFNALALLPTRYNDIQLWLGHEFDVQQAAEICGSDNRAQQFAWYHGMIVEYGKRHSQGKVIDPSALHHVEAC